MDTMGNEIVLGDAELDGEDVEGFDVVGARPHRRALVRPGARRVVTLPPELANASPQGVSTPKEEMDSLPFNIVQPAAGPAPAGLTAIAEAFPQRPFRGERLIMGATLVNSITGARTDVSNLVFISPAWYVGAVQMGASQGDVPLSAYAPTAFGVRLSCPAAGQGTRIYIPMVVRTPLLANESVIISVTLNGRAVR